MWQSRNCQNIINKKQFKEDYIMMNIENLVSGIRNGNECLIHKDSVGQVRENCVYAKNLAEVPAFLLEDGAVEANADGSITLYAVECPATRNFPVYVCYEPVSEENRDKVPGNYGAWSKDNGDATLRVVDGRCYNLPTTISASLMTEEIPEWVISAGFLVNRKGNTYEITRTDANGEVRTGCIGKSMWMQYRKGKVNILNLNEPSASEYILTHDGKDVGVLVELLADLI